MEEARDCRSAACITSKVPRNLDWKIIFNNICGALEENEMRAIVLQGWVQEKSWQKSKGKLGGHDEPRALQFFVWKIICIQDDLMREGYCTAPLPWL